MRQRNVPLGIVLGMAMATIYSVVAVAMYILGGGASESYAIFGVVGAYWLGGIVGGGMLGALLPYTTRRFGSTIVGILVAIPAVVGILMALSGPPTRWGGGEFFAAIIMSLGLGAWGGFSLWSAPDSSGDWDDPGRIAPPPCDESTDTTANDNCRGRARLKGSGILAAKPTHRAGLTAGLQRMRSYSWFRGRSGLRVWSLRTSEAAVVRCPLAWDRAGQGSRMDAIGIYVKVLGMLQNPRDPNGLIRS